MEEVVKYILAVNPTTFLNNALLIAFVLFFCAAFARENKNATSPLRWIDMLLDKTQNRLSLIKLGQFWGIIVSSWVIIFLVQKVDPKDAPGILVWMFPTWLSFIGGSFFAALKLKNKLTGETQ